MPSIGNEIVIEANDENFEEILSATELPALVDFWSVRCAPCRAQSPIIEGIARHYKDTVLFVKVNVAESRQVAQNMNIRSVPAVVIFRNMEVVDVRIGVASQDALIRMLDRALGKSLWQRWFG